MPNYKYHCELCDHTKIVNLPMSSDPKLGILCDHCANESMVRKIIGPADSIKFRDTLGRWFKNKTGKELLGGE